MLNGNTNSKSCIEFFFSELIKKTIGFLILPLEHYRVTYYFYFLLIEKLILTKDEGGGMLMIMTGGLGNGRKLRLKIVSCN